MKIPKKYLTFFAWYSRILVLLIPPAAAFSLGAVFSWGFSDFLGGWATRRANAFLYSFVVNVGGLVAMVGVGLALRTPLPSLHGMLWGIAAGASGGASLALFYKSLSGGNMGLTAPVAAVLSAAIPTIFAIFTQGWPGQVRIAGFFLAASGLWLITREQNEAGTEGLGLAVAAGLGFAGFYICAEQAGTGSAIWLAACSRVGGFIVTGCIVVLRRNFTEITRSGIGWGILGGCMDSVGTLFYVRAAQAGRLDVAVVISSLYPAITVLLAWLVLHEHFPRWRFVGLAAAIAAIPMIAAG